MSRRGRFRRGQRRWWRLDRSVDQAEGQGGAARGVRRLEEIEGYEGC